MIEVKDLVKRYGTQTALNHVSFKVDKGEVLGFLGPNGAGKSTTMNILTGYLSATSGTVTIAGFDVLDNPEEAKRHIGYLPEQPPLYPDMTVKEYLNFIYDLKKTKLPRGPHIKEICELVKITDVYGRVIKHLSKGYRQRVGIAQALVGNPEVLILDEPTVGLDPKQIIEIRKLINHLGRNHTVILSSHILSEVQAVCERIIIIRSGEIVADDTPDNLSKSLVDSHTITARIQGPEREVLKLIQGIPGVRSVNSLGRHESGAAEFSIEPEGDTDVRVPLFNRLADRNWPLLMLNPSELSLEEIFLRLTEEVPAVQEKRAKKPERKEPSESVRETARRVADEIAGPVIEPYGTSDNAQSKEEDEK